MLLEYRVRCLAGTAPTLGDPKEGGPSAPKVQIGQCHALGALRCRGASQNLNEIGAATWTGSAPNVRRQWWLWLCRRGAVTRGCVGRVKGHRTK
jgi:hypothetical protein